MFFPPEAIDLKTPLTPIRKWDIKEQKRSGHDL